jgi:hypothetical protein
VSARNGAAKPSTDGEGRSAAKPQSSAQSWRDVLPVHPAAELFPPMTRDELIALAGDIKQNGLQIPVALTEIEGKPFVLDGRNRLDALEYLGCDVSNSFDAWWGHHLRVEDPFAFVISVNIQRRHLDAEQRRKLIADVLKAKPEQSNRQIAKQVKADHKTVGKVRKEMESIGDVPQLEKTTGADGKARKQPTKRKPAEQKVFDSPQEARGQAAVSKQSEIPSIKGSGFIQDIKGLADNIKNLADAVDTYELDFTQAEGKKAIGSIVMAKADLQRLKSAIERHMESVKLEAAE